jgi:hypothetical protein
MKRILILIVATLFALLACSPANNLTLLPADQAACEQLGSGFNVIGVPDLPTMKLALDGGWPLGEPSAAVKGSFIAARVMTAGYQNYLDKVTTLDDVLTQIEYAYDSYAATCK